MNIESDYLATEILKSNGYYNLINGYKDDFLLPKDSPDDLDEFIQGTELTDLVFQKRVEDDLQNILFKYSLLFEGRLKEAMAHTISQRISVNEKEYLKAKYYRNWKKATNSFDFVRKNILTTKSNPTYYYRIHHNHVPAWILLDNTTLGAARMWLSFFRRPMISYVVWSLLSIKNRTLKEFAMEYTGIHFPYEKFNEKNVIESERAFDKSANDVTERLIELVRNMISIVHNFRNNIAHGNRLKQFEASEPLKLNGLRFIVKKDVISNQEFKSGLGTDDIFSFMLSLTLMLGPFNRSAFLKELSEWQKINEKDYRMQSQFEKYFKSLHLPQNFTQRLESIEAPEA